MLCRGIFSPSPFPGSPKKAYPKYTLRKTMETVKTSAFSVSIANLANKDILQFLITLTASCSMKESVQRFFRRAILNASIFSYLMLNLVQKYILDFHFTIATNIFMKEIVDSSLLRSLWSKFMETRKALISTIIVLNLVNEGLYFCYTIIFTGPYWYK